MGAGCGVRAAHSLTYMRAAGQPTASLPRDTQHGVLHVRGGQGAEAHQSGDRATAASGQTGRPSGAQAAPSRYALFTITPLSLFPYLPSPCLPSPSLCVHSLSPAAPRPAPPAPPLRHTPFANVIDARSPT